MNFLNLSPIEWLLVLAIAALVAGIGYLPEWRAMARPRKKRQKR
jgi:Sec-independent protein translocase protein TatA